VCPIIVVTEGSEITSTAAAASPGP
jgi:hypothetical protein